MAKTWYQKQQAKEAANKAKAGNPETPAVATAPEPEAPKTGPIPADHPLPSRHPVTGATTIPHNYGGVPSREEQAAATEKSVAEAPARTEAEKTNVTSASGDAAARVAPSAPGGLITTKDGTFTREEWAERNKKVV